jgi:hypothetical protein
MRSAAGLLVPRAYFADKPWNPCCPDDGCDDGSDCFDGTLAGSQLVVELPDEWTDDACFDCGFADTYYLDYDASLNPCVGCKAWDYTDGTTTCDCEWGESGDAYFFIRFWLQCDPADATKCRANASVGFENKPNNVGASNRHAHQWYYFRDGLALNQTSWILDTHDVTPEINTCEQGDLCTGDNLSDLTFDKVVP